MKTVLRAVCHLAGLMFMIASMQAQVNYNQTCTSVVDPPDPPQIFTWNVQFTLDKSVILAGQTANGTFVDTCPDDLSKRPDVEAGCLGNQLDWPMYQNMYLYGQCRESWNITDASGTHGGAYLDPNHNFCQTGVIYGYPGNYSASFQYT